MTPRNGTGTGFSARRGARGRDEVRFPHDVGEHDVP